MKFLSPRLAVLGNQAPEAQAPEIRAPKAFRQRAAIVSTLLAALFVALFLPPSAAFAGTPTYTMYFLSSLSSGVVDITQVNNAGQITGAFSVNGGTALDAFFGNFYQGTSHDLGTLGGDGSRGLALNNAGQVTGDAFLAGNGSTHAFLSGPNGGALHDLGTLPGYTDSSGRGVNSAGQVAGGAIGAEGVTHAFLSDPNGGQLHDLGTLGGSNSFAFGVNDAGNVTGYSMVAGDAATHAFFSEADGGMLHDLGTFGGSDSLGETVNNQGEVAGGADTGSVDSTGAAIYHAFLSDPNGGGLHDLGTLGGNDSIAEGLNNAGEVVGYSDLAGAEKIGNTDQDAFLFLNGQMLDLNTLVTNQPDGLRLYHAFDISDTGLITGEWLNNNLAEGSFLLVPNPVPEASTTVSFGLLLGLGIGGMVIAARKKKTATVA